MTTFHFTTETLSHCLMIGGENFEVKCQYWEGRAINEINKR